MWYRITSSQIPWTISELIGVANRMLVDWEQELQKNIPQDTYTLSNDIKIQKAKVDGLLVSGKIFLDPNSPAVAYADFVLNWVPSGDTRNYYKNAGRRNGWTPFLNSRIGTKADFLAKKYLEENITKYI